jgi:hypothetical protein
MTAVEYWAVKPAYQDEDTAPPVFVAVPVLPAAGQAKLALAGAPVPVSTTCCIA